MTESPLLRDVLKDEWGFDGVVMSDWGAGRARARRRGGARPVMPGPTGRGATRWSRRCGTGA